MGLDLRFGQVSCNSENVQNLAVLHGFIKAKFVSHLYKLEVIITLSKFISQILGSRPTVGSCFVEFWQRSKLLHDFIKASLFPFYTNL